MAWAYYDESGEYSKWQEPGTLMDMSVGGCVAPLEKWKNFEIEWKQALDSEGLSFFHMTDFQNWKPPFDFKLTDGGRDIEKHKRIMNALLEIMLNHIEYFAGFAAPSVPHVVMPDKKKAHKAFLAEAIHAAVRHAALEVADFYGEKVHLVFGQQEHLSAVHIGKYVDLYNRRAGNKISGYSVEDPKCVRPLQGADVWAYEFSKAQRILTHRPRYPLLKLEQGIKARQLQLHIEWGLAQHRKFKRLPD